MNINKRYIVDEQGNPKEVIIPMEDFRKIEALLGWDLDDGAVKELSEARRDRESGRSMQILRYLSTVYTYFPQSQYSVKNEQAVAQNQIPLSGH